MKFLKKIEMISAVSHITYKSQGTWNAENHRLRREGSEQEHYPRADSIAKVGVTSAMISEFDRFKSLDSVIIPPENDKTQNPS